MLGSLVFLLLFHYCVGKTVYFSEQFDTKDALDKWVHSTYNGDKQGSFKLSAGSNPVNAEEDMGIITSEDARFYGISSKLQKPVDTNGKNFVVQFSVKYDKTVDCGGAYIKLMGSDLDQSKFHGESPYKIMFGPDICGMSTKKVHVIFNYKGTNHLIKKEIRCKDDLKTHLYTLIIKPDNTYVVKIDNEVAEEGSLEDDWDMIPPKEIDDMSVKKPSDWVDEPEMEDPNDEKPADWEQPQKIPDENAKKPEDWDDEMDGVWEKPLVDNPAYKGEWSPKRIPNPKYKGVWVPPRIKNPDYKPDPNLHAFDDISYVGFDLWQVASGSIFDNILLTDDVEFAAEEGKRLWKKRFDAEEKQEKAKEPETKTEEDKKDDEPVAPEDESDDHDEL